MEYSNTSFSLDLSSHGYCAVAIESVSPEISIEICQQAIWMATALRVSCSQEVRYADIDLKPFIIADAQLRFMITTYGVVANEQSCWIELFGNPVIARGFPIPKRNNDEQGLEISLEMMAALGGARHVTEYDGGLVMKGCSSMFIPVKRTTDAIQWHFIKGNGDESMPYHELKKWNCNRAMLTSLNFDSLKSTRAFLGWWKLSETHLGTVDADYDSIGWSPAGVARRSTRFAGAEVGFQAMATGKLNFIIGAKDSRVHFALKGPLQRVLRCAEKTPVVLYDLEDRRACFVFALDVMLHIIQTRSRVSLAPYLSKSDNREILPVNPRVLDGTEARQAALGNRGRLLYEGYPFEDVILDICLTSVDTLVLLATGLKEIIKPVDDLDQLCHR